MSRHVQVWNLPISPRNFNSKLPLKIGKFPCQKETKIFCLRVSSWLSGANVLLNLAGFAYVFRWWFQLPVPMDHEGIHWYLARRYGPNLSQYFSTCSSSQKPIQDDVERQQVTLKVRYEKLAMTPSIPSQNLNFYLFKKVAGFSPCQVLREKNMPPKGSKRWVWYDWMGNERPNSVP